MERSWGCPFPGGAKARLEEGSCPQQGLEPGGLRGPFQPKLLHSLNRARKLQHLSHLSTREEDAAPFAWQQTVTQTKRGGKRRSRAERCSLTHANPPEPSLFQHSRDEGMTRALAWIAPTPPGDRSHPQRLPGPTSPAAAGGGFVPRCRRQHQGGIGASAGNATLGENKGCEGQQQQRPGCDTGSRQCSRCSRCHSQCQHGWFCPGVRQVKGEESFRGVPLTPVHSTAVCALTSGVMGPWAA